MRDSKLKITTTQDKQKASEFYRKNWSVPRTDKDAAEIFKRKKLLRAFKDKYRVVDLFSGIGGIRRGFELTGRFKNVASIEKDKHCCQTYEALFGANPEGDITLETSKKNIPEHDVLCAGFPCQAFSSAGKKEGFADRIRGTLFFDIVDILQRHRPKAFFLENVEGLITHRRGETFRIILETLVLHLGYSVIGVKRKGDSIEYNSRDFLINSVNFGIPHNRPRIYIIGFDITEPPLDYTPKNNGVLPLYADLDELIDRKVDPKYYLSAGYLETLKKHKERHAQKGNGFGYQIVNARSGCKASAILATGGSGKERNLIYDPQPEIYGMMVGNKKSPINHEGIRHMTPWEWGRLQGFVGYAFMDGEKEGFCSPVSETQLYKQFGNAVTIPVVQRLAEEIAIVLDNI